MNEQMSDKVATLYPDIWSGVDGAAQLPSSILALFVSLGLLVLVLLMYLWREKRYRNMAELKLDELNQQLESRIKRRTQELHQSEQNLFNTFMSAPFGMMIVDEQGTIEQVNRHALQIFGYQDHELCGKGIEVLVPESMRTRHVADRAAYAEERNPRFMGKGRHLKGVNKEGQEIPIEIGLNTFENLNGERKIITSISDTSELIGVYEQLTEEHERALVTLNSIMDGVISTNIDGVIISMNPVSEKLTGWDFSQAKNRHISDVYQVMKERTSEIVENPLILCLQQEAIIEAKNENELKHKSGMRIPIDEHAAPIKNSQGEIIGAVLVFHDVTQSRAHRHQIEYQANHDALTGLLNRREFDYRLQSTVQHLAQKDFDNVLLFLDLDRFKLVNDSAGHAAGDELLKQLTRVMSSKLRQRDTLARLGGDEFAVLLEHCTRDIGLKVANTLREAVDSFRFFWGGQVFSVGVSIGMVIFSSNKQTADELLENADAACYRAKASGRNQVQIHDSEATRKKGESSIVNILSDAYENDRMLLYQQQIMPLQKDDPQRYYEVFIRMRGEQGELLLPESFLPAAKRYGLSSMLDRWVVRQCINWLQQHLTDFDYPPILSINLSEQSINDPPFSAFVHDEIVESNLEGELFCFDIAESAAIKNLDNTRQFMQGLKHLGCQFALDDFGSGQASYAQLNALPVDYLKIDGQYVSNIDADPVNYSIVRSVNEVGQVLGIKTIAEFVENEEVKERMQQIGVDFLQGYATAVPAPLDQLLSTEEAIDPKP